MARGIPGFYYDEEKKKYFRVQPNHAVPVGSAAYTTQHVQAQKETRRTEIEQQSQQRRQHIGHIRRAATVRTLSYKVLNIRIRGPRRCQDLIAVEFARNLAPKQACAPGTLHPDQNLSIRCFHINREGRLTIARGPDEFGTKISGVWPNSTYGQVSENAYESPLPCPDETRSYVNVSAIADFAHGFNAPYSRATGFSDGDRRLHIINNSSRPVVFSAFEPHEPTTIWDVADSPTNIDLAVATEHGILLCHGPMVSANPAGIARWDNPNPAEPQYIESTPRHKRMNAQLNITYQEHMIISGERSGRVNLTDTRTLATIAQLQHSSAVLGTTAGKHAPHIIVHGFSSTCTYDLRFNRASSRTFGPRSRHAQHHPPSTPVMNFNVPPQRHTDHYSHGKKVAYSRDLDMVIACSAQSSFRRPRNFVTLYSAGTGRVLDSPLTREVFVKPVGAVALRRLRDGPESIITLSNGELLEWTVQPGVEDPVTVKPTRAQRDDLRERKRLITRLMDSRPEDYSIARLWEEGNLGPRRI